MARILVIDEDDLMRANLRRLLVLEGHEVREAEGGSRGIDLALGDPPDLVLCDLVMPDLDGYAVMRRLRADPRTAGVPFVAVTGSAAPTDAQRGFRSGADGYVTKPFEIDHLLSVVSDCSAGGAHHRVREPGRQPGLNNAGSSWWRPSSA